MVCRTHVSRVECSVQNIDNVIVKCAEGRRVQTIPRPSIIQDKIANSCNNYNENNNNYSDGSRNDINRGQKIATVILYFLCSRFPIYEFKAIQIEKYQACYKNTKSTKSKQCTKKGND